MTSSSGVMQRERQEEHSSSREVSSNVVEVTHDERNMKRKKLTEIKCVSDVVDEGMDVGRGVSGGDVSVPSNQRLQGEEFKRFVGKSFVLVLVLVLRLMIIPYGTNFQCKITAEYNFPFLLKVIRHKSLSFFLTSYSAVVI